MAIIEDDELVGTNEEVELKLGKIQRELSELKKRGDSSKAIQGAVSSLTEAIEDILGAITKKDSDSGVEKLIGDLSKHIKATSEAIHRSGTDMAPIVQATEMMAKQGEKNAQAIAVALLDVQQQNKEIIKTLGAIKFPEPKDDKHIIAMLKSISESVLSSNEAMTKAVKAIIETKAPVAEERKPKAFKHTIKYSHNGGKLESVESVEIDPPTVTK